MVPGEQTNKNIKVFFPVVRFHLVASMTYFSATLCCARIQGEKHVHSPTSLTLDLTSTNSLGFYEHLFISMLTLPAAHVLAPSVRFYFCIELFFSLT